MIYVDELREYPNGKWCHMWHSENDVEALHTFSARLGLKRDWLHVSVGGLIGSFPHYDLRPSMRALALERGAKFMPLKDWIVEKKRP